MDFSKLVQSPPVVLIMLLQEADAAAMILGVPAVRPAALLLPTVLTAELPGDVFFTGTTTLLCKKKKQIKHTVQ